MQATNDHQAVLAARRRFFEDGRTPRGLIAEPILRSWTRCAALGLEAAKTPEVAALSSGGLREACERHEQLRRLCRPEIEALYLDARDTDSVVILTDPQGLVLDAVGSTDFADKAARVALRPGVQWHEAATGTNAIGMALIERRPVAVHGAEHYFAPHRILSCHAAPILEPDGRLAGALDLSGHAALPHAHALGLLRVVVDQIEHRLFEGRYPHCQVLRLHSERSHLGTAREGVLVFDGPRLIAANRHALALLGLDWDSLGQCRYSELFGTTLSQLRDGQPLRGLRGREFHGRLDAEAARPLALSATAAGVPARPTPITEAIVLDAAARQALARASRILDADLPVLLQGETGAGKEVFARQLHAACSRAQAPLVAVNCAALPENLIESELFGYEEGAFTGARRRGAVGLLRQAQGGVLFLDEIGDMPLALQSRLLRVLQQREVTPLGGGKPVAVDFRLICATHRDLRQAVAEGRFRADLYYRIAQYTLPLPALREHADLPGLIADLWIRLQAGPPSALPAELMARLAAHDWPGNYRELVSCLRALLALAGPDCRLTLDDLPPALRDPPQPFAAVSTEATLSALAEGAMRSALAAAEGNVSAAARRLGVSRSTLYRRLLQKPH
ncbi:sigma-54-dependent Fis family transcriptional regulator [Stagnimonas aquatica]|uniref:Sigma-54-dependent Fis family transcriptional regulator n=1 Tax=Stagnimonas aquatica TaxID=2689987 RepID=A0A3N0VH91_9GAMM|nr:sigma-54-dependent Fis family transcriptional regulator [Stagnimonas aquatica]ROH92113.1 sigma-54-dependent Fis family transcriptional regulator [Stagnimonas aquatica]